MECMKSMMNTMMIMMITMTIEIIEEIMITTSEDSSEIMIIDTMIDKFESCLRLISH